MRRHPKSAPPVSRYSPETRFSAEMFRAGSLTDRLLDDGEQLAVLPPKREKVVIPQPELWVRDIVRAPWHPEDTLAISFYGFGSVGNPASIHSNQPPFREYTSVYPLSIKLNATLALVCSLGQSQ